MALDLQELFERAKERNLLPDEESVVIALHMPNWDNTLGRGTKGTFRKPNKSVSRLEIYPLETILTIFQTQIGGGSLKIEGYGILTVGDIKEAGMQGDSQIQFEVTEDPVPGNAAHAEIISYNVGKQSIKAKVPDGICNKLLSKMRHFQIPSHT